MLIFGLIGYNIDGWLHTTPLFVIVGLMYSIIGSIILLIINNFENMYWTLELASSLDDAPWPASKDELIDYANRSGAPEEVIENLQELEDDGEVYESIEDIWPDYPTKEDFFFNEEEY